jgi:lipopolysaccharide biosynthesis regulator YciM
MPHSIGPILDLFIILRDHDNAIHAYETAVALFQEPTYGVHALLGDCYRGKGRFRDAIVQYDYQLVDLASKGLFCEGVIRCLIQVYIETGDYDNAFKRLDGAILMHPYKSSLKSLLGEVFMATAEYDAAIAAFEAAYETAIEDGGEEELVHLWKLIGHAKEHKSDLRGAIDAYKMAVEIDPDDEKCREALDELEETMRDQVVEEKGE